MYIDKQTHLELPGCSGLSIHSTRSMCSHRARGRLERVRRVTRARPERLTVGFGGCALAAWGVGRHCGTPQGLSSKCTAFRIRFRILELAHWSAKRNRRRRLVWALAPRLLSLAVFIKPRSPMSVTPSVSGARRGSWSLSYVVHLKQSQFWKNPRHTGPDAQGVGGPTGGALGSAGRPKRGRSAGASAEVRSQGATMSAAAAAASTEGAAYARRR